MRTILFAVALLIFTASAYAAGQAPKAVECKDSTAQINGHEVTTTSITTTLSGAPDRSGTVCIVTEEWKKDGKLDRANGPAEFSRNTTTGVVTDEAWYKDGKEDRADGPAEIWRHPETGFVTLEKWYKDGKQIAPPPLALVYAADPVPKAVECKPSTTQIDGHQVTTACAPENLGSYQEWRKDGKLDRADGPASIIRGRTGTVLSEFWYRDGKLDRADGPAIIDRDAATGLVIEQHWFKDGQLSHTIYYTSTGNVGYGMDGKQIAIAPPRAAAQ
jgi:hypothetical protein